MIALIYLFVTIMRHEGMQSMANCIVRPCVLCLPCIIFISCIYHAASKKKRYQLTVCTNRELVDERLTFCTWNLSMHIQSNAILKSNEEEELSGYPPGCLDGNVQCIVQYGTYCT